MTYTVNTVDLAKLKGLVDNLSSLTRTHSKLLDAKKSIEGQLAGTLGGHPPYLRFYSSTNRDIELISVTCESALASIEAELARIESEISRYDSLIEIIPTLLEIK